MSNEDDFVTVLSDEELQLGESLKSYGIDIDALDTTQKVQLQRQERFLFWYRRFGTKAACSRRSSITRQVLYLWENADALGFKQRLRDAHEEYVNSQEELLQDIGEGKKHPLAVIARLNKESEEWNRPTTLIIDERPQKVLDALQHGRNQSVIEGRWKLAKEESE